MADNTYRMCFPESQKENDQELEVRKETNKRPGESIDCLTNSSSKGEQRKWRLGIIKK